jgi:hypothetical protein
MFEQRNNRHGRLGQAGSATRDRPGVRLTLCEAGSLHRDLEIAKTVQKRLLPQKSQRSSGFLSETYYRPLHCIGGDYYDFVLIEIDSESRSATSRGKASRPRLSWRTCKLRCGRVC